MQGHIDNRRFLLDADVRVDRILENLVNVRRMEGIIDFYRVNGAPSGEIALAIIEFVKRGEEGLSMGAE
jgi:hypothetical protein